MMSALSFLRRLLFLTIILANIIAHSKIDRFSRFASHGFIYKYSDL